MNWNRLDDKVNIHGNVFGVRLLTVSVRLLIATLVALIMSDPISASAQTQPDLSTWRSYEVPEHGLSLKAPADWIQNEVPVQASGDIFSLSVPGVPPELSAGCGILATPTKSGKAVDLDNYIEKLSEERLLKALSARYSNLYLHKMEVVTLPDRKSLHTIFSGDRKSGRWTHMNFDMAEGDTFYRFQCFFRPKTINEYYLTFWAIAQSLHIKPR